MVLGAILVIGILLILFVVYTVVVLFFTYWYITFPAVALIIIYKKRKSIRKLKFRKRGPKLYTHGAIPSSELNTGIEWVRQQNAEDERRRQEFSEKSLRYDHQSVRV